MPTKKLGSLSDIDGLRALAVVAVVLFHLDFEFFQGGYVGVDIFFVISGFLISGLIRERIALHQFSLADFYANRIRRLLPAILATVFCHHRRQSIYPAATNARRFFCGGDRIDVQRCQY